MAERTIVTDYTLNLYILNAALLRRESALLDKREIKDIIWCAKGGAMLLSQDATQPTLMTEFLGTPSGAFGTTYGTLLLVVIIMLLGAALIGRVIPNERYFVKPRVNRNYVQLEPAIPRNAQNTLFSPRPYDPKAFTPSLTSPDRFKKSDFFSRSVPRFRIENDWTPSDKSAARWLSSDCCICVQSDVIEMVDFNGDPSIHRVQVGGQPPIYAYVLGRDAVPPFEVRWEKNGSLNVEVPVLASGGLAIGFNRAALRQLSIADDSSLEVSITPISGLSSIAYALKAAKFRRLYLISQTNPIGQC